MELKGFNGVLYMMSEWVMRLSAANLMWFILSLPFFTLLVAVDMTDPAGRIFFGLAGWIFASFLVFPATSAVFAVVRAWIVEEDYSSVFKKYWAYMKSDYKADLKTGMAFAAIWLFWYYGYFYLHTAADSMALAMLLAGAGLFVYTVNYMSITAHYRMNSGERVKNAFFLSAGRPLTSLVILAGSAALLWVSIFQLLWLLPLLACSLTAFLSFSAFHRAVVKISGKPVPDQPA